MNTGAPGTPRFGGPWTQKKLEVLEGYLRAYTTALRDKPSPERPFIKAFIDGFAGTGYREERAKPAEPDLLFPDLAADEPQGLLEGSARRALQVEPSFDHYIFIESDLHRCEDLEALRTEFPERSKQIEIRPGDANQIIQGLCDKDWRSRRAVLFLDPYGMQVEWSTIEAVDMWLLFPLGIGVNRLLTRSGDIPEAWRNRVSALLGTEDWYEAFYRAEPVADLFGSDRVQIVKAKADTIGRYFNERLKGVFCGVAEKPGVLRNSKNNPLYLLCFGVGSKSGRDIALRIANSLLTKLR